LLVVAAASLTLAAVAFTPARTLFQYHTAMAPGSLPAATAWHINEGFTSAMVLSLATATGVGLAAAAGARWLVA
jgi:hypothetical protein